MNYSNQKMNMGMPLLLLMSLLPTYVEGQQLISPTANEIAGTNITISYSVGEIAISTLSSDTQYVTQGFLQPYFVDTSTVNGSQEIYLRSSSTSEINKLNVFMENEKLIYYMLYNISGAKVSEGPMNEINQLNVSDLPSGIYVLYAFSENHEYFQTSKIIKQ